MLNAANLHLADCRTQVRATTNAVQEAKRVLQLEIEKYIANTPQTWTPEMNSRAYAQASLEARRQRAARFGSGTTQSANDFVRDYPVPPGGTKGGKRGAVSRKTAAHYGFVVPGSPAAVNPSPAEQVAADARARAGIAAPGKPMPSK